MIRRPLRAALVAIASLCLAAPASRADSHASEDADVPAAAREGGGFDPFGFDATLLVPCVAGGSLQRYAGRCDGKAPPADGEGGVADRSIDAERVDTADWTFEPDPAVRRGIVEGYAARMDSVGNPDAARNADILRRVDLIGVAGEALERVGLSTSNLADVMGVHVANVHDAATDEVVESTPENAAALSRQMAAVLAAAAPPRLAEPGERQRLADGLIIDAVLLGARTEACVSGQAEGFDCETFRARAAEIGQALYGVDLPAFDLDPDGLRPR